MFKRVIPVSHRSTGISWDGAWLFPLAPHVSPLTRPTRQGNIPSCTEHDKKNKGVFPPFFSSSTCKNASRTPVEEQLHEHAGEERETSPFPQDAPTTNVAADASVGKSYPDVVTRVLCSWDSGQMGQDEQGRLKARLEHSLSRELLRQVCAGEQERCPAYPASSWKFRTHPLPPAPSELPRNSSLAAKHQRVLNIKVLIRSYVQIPCFTKGFSSTPHAVLPFSLSCAIFFFLFLPQLGNEIKQKITARLKFLRWEYRADASSGTVRGNSKS